VKRRVASQQAGQHKAVTSRVSHSQTCEGKTATVMNLGAVFAQAGERVVFVSCDLLRHPPPLSQSAAPDVPELASVLASEVPLDQAMTPVADVEGLWSLSTRSAVPNPTELLCSRRARDLFTELAQRFGDGRSLRGGFPSLPSGTPGRHER
jgi:Mrp family chromosome partitioning ATPase